MYLLANGLKKYFGISAPRLACTGLNPHAGENGSMGREEQTIIAPALKQLRDAGINVSGPVSADTAFHAEAREAVVEIEWRKAVETVEPIRIEPVEMIANRLEVLGAQRHRQRRAVGAAQDPVDVGVVGGVSSPDRVNIFRTCRLSGSRQQQLSDSEIDFLKSAHAAVIIQEQARFAELAQVFIAGTAQCKIGSQPRQRERADTAVGKSAHRFGGVVFAGIP